MQSTVTKRERGGAHDVTDEILEQGVESRVGLNRKLDVGDLMDDNDMERILSRPSLPRRKLDIFEAPEFVQRLSGYQEATVGETVTFSGQYKAFPKPTVKWFKDEEEVSETKRHNIDLSSEAQGIVRLIVSELIRQDEGAYKCKVENQEGVASTTGYLSVSGKVSDKSHSQKKKLAHDRVSTTPYLRPIAEQKSVEEREEKEYQRLPPSPLQQFIDNVRHGTKSMHGPIVYADLEEVYPDEYVIKDFEDDTAGEEEDVFDEECSNPTPSVSPVNDLPIEDALRLPKDTSHFRGTSLNNNDSDIQAVREFLLSSAEARTVPLVTQTSGEDSAYDSDGQDSLTQVPCVDKGAVLDSINEDTCRRNRKKKLTLQRVRAIEFTETEIPSNNNNNNNTQQRVTATSAAITNSSCQTAPDGERNTDSTGSDTEIRSDMEYQRENVSKHEKPISEIGLEVARRSAVDVIFGWIDSPWIQFFTGFIMSTVVLALAADIPPVYLIAVVVFLSIASFVSLERHLKVE